MITPPYMAREGNFRIVIPDVETSADLLIATKELAKNIRQHLQ
jgi:hypothetical protein